MNTVDNGIVKAIFNQLTSPRNAARLKAVSRAFRSVGADSAVLRQDWMRVKTNVGRALDKKWRLRRKNLTHHNKAIARAFDSIVRVGGDVPARAKTPLLVMAAKYDQTDVVKLLLDRGASVDARNSLYLSTNGRESSSALEAAAAYGGIKTIRLLLNRGASMRRDYPFVIMGMAGGAVDTVRLLLDKGAAIEATAPCDIDRRRPLMWAALHRHTNVVKLLLDRGANIEAKDYEGKTALMWAALTGHAATVELLLDRGAALNTKDNEGKTALMWALRYGHQHIVEMLGIASREITSKKRKR